jgi:FKBP-type peptidyl-prolyl cis-trans isomerase
MIRIVLAAMAALALAACNPSVKFDPAKPWDTLHPWQHNWAEIKRLPSGVEYIILKKGDGKSGYPSPADRVEVNYDGRFAQSGEVFDSSFERKATETFRLNEVVKGWTEGLQKMQIGDEFMFWIPYDQAYGEDGGGRMPPKSDLMFHVALVNIFPAVASDDKAWAKVTPWPTNSSDVIRRPSGLEYLVINSGKEGPSPTDADDVVVHFQARLESVDKEEGDTPADLKQRSIALDTFDMQQPSTFPVSGLEAGWGETVKSMRKGDRWMVRMPAQVLYGSEGDGRIPPGATTIWEISLEDFFPHMPGPGDVVPPATPPPR